MLTFHKTKKKRFERKLPSLLERPITVSGHEKCNFLGEKKTVLIKIFYKSQNEQFGQIMPNVSCMQTVDFTVTISIKSIATISDEQY